MCSAATKRIEMREFTSADSGRVFGSGPTPTPAPVAFFGHLKIVQREAARWPDGPACAVLRRPSTVELFGGGS